MSDVIPEDVRWLWPQRVPIGKITMLSGDPKLGKTFLVLDIVSRITTGRHFPDVENTFGSRRDVLWVSAEDDDADTIRPRLDKLGADASRVHSLKFFREVRDDKSIDRELDLSRDIEAIDLWLRNHPLVCLLVLDPIAAFLGKIDTPFAAHVTSFSNLYRGRK